MREMPRTPHVSGRAGGHLRWQLRRAIVGSIGFVVYVVAITLVAHRVLPHRFLSPLIWAAIPYGLFLLGSFWHKELGALVRNRRKGARGEEAVGAILCELPPAFRVLNDVYIGAGNVDHVVVGPTGIFAVETKAWSGRLSLAPGRKLQLNGWDRSDASRQAVRSAMTLRTKLAGLSTMTHPYVNAVIALPSTGLPLGKMQLPNVDVIEATTLCEFIMRRGVRLPPEDIALVEDALRPLVNGRKKKSRAK